MKKFVSLFSAIFILALAANAFACVGKTLIIGALDAPNERLMAQMMAVIINERTGTTVNVELYPDQDKLLTAVKKREINIYVENTGRALEQLGMEVSGDADTVYATVKEEFKTKLHLVLLKPFGRSLDEGEKPFLTVPVIAEGILIDYPALPRVINKLRGIVDDKKYGKLVAAVESGDKPNQVARDFLKKKRFI